MRTLSEADSLGRLSDFNASLVEVKVASNLQACNPHKFMIWFGFSSNRLMDILKSLITFVPFSMARRSYGLILGTIRARSFVTLISGNYASLFGG
jgi:hypothetical protein